jgi:hypothetical protein
MADSHNFGLKSVGNNVKLGKGGPRVRNTSGVVEARTTADTAFAVVRGADPVGYDDFVTKRYLETQANVYATGQIDGGSPPAVAAGATYLCTTTGGAYTAGKLYYAENATWNEVSPAAGLTISVTVALSGGTLTFTADHRYMWDADGAAWVDIGPAAAASGIMKTARASLAFGTTSPVSIGSALPTNAVVSRIVVNVTQAFNGTAPTVSFGVSGSLTELGLVTESDLATTGTYVIDCYKLYASNEQVIATYVADSSSAGAATIEMHYSLS